MLRCFFDKNVTFLAFHYESRVPLSVPMCVCDSNEYSTQRAEIVPLRPAHVLENLYRNARVQTLRYGESELPADAPIDIAPKADMGTGSGIGWM
jgi:hypothetical protein